MEQQKLMDEVYEKWQKKECGGMARLEVIEKHFTPLHRAAVQLGNFNYQVNNGGFAQWEDNRYMGEDIDDIIKYMERGASQNIKHCAKIHELLLKAKSSEELEETKDSYEEDEMSDSSEFFDALSLLDDEFYELKDVLKSFQKFLDRFDEKVKVKNIGTFIKPHVELIGTDRNVFNVIGKVVFTLDKAGYHDKAVEFKTKALNANSYDKVLQLAMEYAIVS